MLQDMSEQRDHCVPSAKKEKKDPLGHSTQIQKEQSGQDAASRLFGFWDFCQNKNTDLAR